MPRRLLSYFFLTLLSLGGLFLINTSSGLNPIPQAAAQSPVDVALASQGTTIRYYEGLNPLNNGSDPLAPYPCRAQFPTSAIIDGDRKGLNYGNGGVFSTCDQQYVVPNSGSPFINTGPLILDFNQLRTINQINLFTTQDNLNSPSDPTPNMTFTTEGTADFIISYWNVTGKVWTNIQPSTDWQNDYHVWKTGTFGNITTTKIRINFYPNRVPPSHHIRITEIEAWEANSNHGDFGVQYMTNQALIVGNGSPALAHYFFFPSWPWGPNGWPGGNAPIDGEYYPLSFTFSNIPNGMSFTYPGYRNYDGNDPCLHVEDFVLPSCLNDSSGRAKYQPNDFSLYGNTNPGTYYFNMTATEQLEPGVTRAPFTHTYTFRLDVLGADIKANGQETSTSILSGQAATIDWSSYTDPDPAGYTQSGAPSCSVTPSGWTGLSGSQSTGSLTSATTYTNTCSYAGINMTDTVTVNMTAPTAATVTAQCATTNNGFYSASSGPGAGASCNLTGSNQPGFIKWTSANSADGLCSVTALTSGDSMSSSSTSANPTTASQTNSLGNPPATHQFRITCNSASGGATGTDTVTFNVPSSAPYNLHQSTKHLIAVNQPNMSDSQLAAANTNPCDGQGRVVDPTYSFEDGDIATFAINICNTGGSDLVFNGSGDNTHSIVITESLGNLVKPAAGWNASVSCGNDCQIASVDDSQSGRIVFTLQVKPGGSNRLLAAGGVWSVFFNAAPTAPSSSTASYFYFTSCITNLTVHNAPAADDVYNNIVGQPFDAPGLCLQSLFFRGGTPPDRHEIAP